MENQDGAGTAQQTEQAGDTAVAKTEVTDGTGGDKAPQQQKPAEDGQQDLAEGVIKERLAKAQQDQPGAAAELAAQLIAQRGPTGTATAVQTEPGTDAAKPAAVVQQEAENAAQDQGGFFHRMGRDLSEAEHTSLHFIRQKANALLGDITDLGSSRELSIARTKLEECIHYVTDHLKVG